MNKMFKYLPVSLARDIPIIKINYENFKKLYSNLKFFIICKNKEKIYLKNILIMKILK